MPDDYLIDALETAGLVRFQLVNPDEPLRLEPQEARDLADELTSAADDVESA